MYILTKQSNVLITYSIGFICSLLSIKSESVSVFRQATILFLDIRDRIDPVNPFVGVREWWSAGLATAISDIVVFLHHAVGR
ncbi:MAG: hypothetical protein IPP46_04140 [Bacteroidetes bacterium]|nr:hypothetical protein [Bacteroidota bacterium]